MDTTKEWQIIGVNDDQHVCDICGKENLKRVVWIESVETGQILACGTTCVAKMLGRSIKEQKKAESAFVKEAKKKIEKELFIFNETNRVPIEVVKAQDSAYIYLDSRKLTFSERKAYLANCPEVQAFNWHCEDCNRKYQEKKSELEKKYGIKK